VRHFTGASEYNAGHIKGADNVFVGSLPIEIKSVKIKSSGSLPVRTEGCGYSLLAKNGFKNISNYSQEWLNGLRKITTEN
jgi:hydroxyacylglutathione hydrolase